MSASNTTSLGNSSPKADRVLPKASRRESLLAIRAGLDMHEAFNFLAVGAKRGQRLFGLGRRQLHAAMPGGNVFHIGHALAFDRVGDYHRRLFTRGAGLAQGFENLRNVMAVDLRHRPTEG